MVPGLEYLFHETKSMLRELLRTFIFHNGEIMCSNANGKISSRDWGDDSVVNTPDTKVW